MQLPLLCVSPTGKYFASLLWADADVFNLAGGGIDMFGISRYGFDVLGKLFEKGFKCIEESVSIFLRVVILMHLRW